MPPPRRRPVPPPPTRRPRVAGLRHPDAPAADVPVDAPATDAPVADRPRRSTRPVPPEGPNETTARLAEPVRDRIPTDDQANGTPSTGAPRPAKPRAAEPGAAESGARAAGRRRPALPKPAVEPAATKADPREADRHEADQRPAAGRSPLLVPIALAVAAVLLGGLAVWFGVMWSSARDAGSNTALTDSAGTSEVTGQVVAAVNTTFSYDYTNVGKTEQAAQNLLTGSALCQYNALFKVIQQQAPSQKLVLTTTVTNKGVQELTGNTARVLLIVDQKDTRVSTNQPVESQAALTVSAVKQGGTWKISNIDTFNGQSPTPGCS